MAPRANDVYTWMVSNVDRIVLAVKADGGQFGPASQGLLEEGWRRSGGGRQTDKARELLRVKLEQAGFVGLISR